MTEPDESILAQIGTLGGVRGHVVLGYDESQPESNLAIWQVTPEGHPSGAWVLRMEELLQQPIECRRKLALIERRCLVAADPQVSVPLATRIAEGGDVKIKNDEFRRSTLSLAQMWVSIVAARADYVTGAGTSLPWRRELDDSAPATLEAFAAVVGLRARSDVPVTRRALMTADVVAWLVAQWQDTETVRMRRKPLKEQFGPAAALPPDWLSALQRAYERVLPFPDAS
ncbi:DUF6218 family protein [Jatrophihabitans sp. DSM 45814]